MPKRSWQREIENDMLAELDHFGVDDTCPIDGGQGALLGALGTRYAFRCIDCGYTFTRGPTKNDGVAR